MNNIEPTLSETLLQLKNEGYTEDFNLKPDCIECSSKNLALSPSDFNVDKVFRFEGQSDPDDQTILYAISSEKYHLKGVLVNAFGIYSDAAADALMAKLRVH